MEVLGSLRLEARLAPERIPVKHGKKSERHSEKPYLDRVRSRLRVSGQGQG